MEKDYLSLIENKEDEMFKLYEEIVNIDSDSYNLKGLEELSQLIVDQFNLSNFLIETYKYDKAGPIISIKKPGKRKKNIILLGHIDTVFPDGKTKENPFRIEDNKIYGPGVVDMKGGVVQMIYALKILDQLNYNDYGLKLLLVSDEEIAHINSNAVEIFEREAKNAKLVLCCETGRVQDALVLGRKGTGTIKITSYGKAAHAGNQLKEGRNAILSLSKALLDITSIDLLDDETTLSPGLISGGSATNTVAEKAEAYLDFRYLDINIARKLKEEIEKIVSKPYIDGTRLELDFKVQYPPMKPTEESFELLEHISRCNQELFSNKLGYLLVGGGSDASFFSSFGVPSICGLGVRGDHSHTDKEYGIKSSLVERVKLLVKAILDFS